MKYQVVVGNIGTVYDGINLTSAMEQWYEYRRMSMNDLYSKVYHEPVTMLVNGEIDPNWVYLPRV